MATELLGTCHTYDVLLKAKRLKPRTLFPVFLLGSLLIGLLASISFVAVPVHATGANWLTGYSYRKSHVINNATGAGANYQVKIIVVNSSNADSGNTVNINNKMRSDFGDVNWTSDDGSTCLSYWMEKLYSGKNATFWVKVAADLSSNSQTIYVYYGNSTITKASSGAATFIEYDDFEAETYAGWYIWWTGTLSVNTTSSYEGANSLQVTGTDSNSYGAYRLFSSSYSSGRVLVWAKCNKTGQSLSYFVGSASSGWTTRGSAQTSAIGTSFVRTETVWTGASGSSPSGTYTDTSSHGISWSGSGSVTEIMFPYENGVLTFNVDAICLAKYVSPEPVHSTWGSEETRGDSTPPTYSSIGANTTVAGALCSFSCLINDDTDVSTYIFSTNNTGTWTNDTGTTFVNFFNTTAAWANVTKTLNDTVGNVVSYVWYANDTSNNWSSSDQYDLTLTAPYRPSLQMTPDNVTCRIYLETFSVQINVTNANDAQAFNFTIYYDPQVLNCSSVSWGELGTGTMTETDTTNGILEGNVAGSPLNGNHWLLNITFQADKAIIWKNTANKLEGKIWFHQAQLNFTDNSTLQYIEGGINQIDVNQAAYTFLPIQGDVNNDGTVNVLDIRIIAFYYGKTPADPEWPAASKYDLNNDNTIDVLDLRVVTANFGFTYP